MKSFTFNEWLGLLLATGLIYLMAFRTLPEQVLGAFIAILTLISNYFFRKVKPQ